MKTHQIQTINNLVTSLKSLKRPFAIILVGLPGSGKTTVANHITSNNPDIFALSTDSLIEEYAEKHGLNYFEAFNQLEFKDITIKYERQLLENSSQKKNLILDQTHLRKNKRVEKVRQLTSIGYKVVAIACVIPMDILLERLAEREKETGKHIPNSVLNNMHKNYEPPTIDEGFSTILKLSTK